MGLHGSLPAGVAMTIETWSDEEGIVRVLDEMGGDFTRNEWARGFGIRVDVLDRLRTQYGWHFRRPEPARPEET